MQNLLNYIEGLNLSARNRNWLGNKLLNAPLKTKSRKKVSKEILAIPEEFRCDPYEVSPSGDPFFADRRNVEELNRCIEEAKNEPGYTMLPNETLEEFLQRIGY